MGQKSRKTRKESSRSEVNKLREEEEENARDRLQDGTIFAHPHVFMNPYELLELL